MAGLPASGKSAIAQNLKSTLSAVLLDKDSLRDCLFKENVEYSREQDDLCVDVMYDVACFHILRRPQTPVILDGRTYTRRYQVEAVKKTALRASCPLVLIECVCSRETALNRLRQDKATHLAKDRDAALYEKSRAAAEPLEESRLTLDTDESSIEQSVQAIKKYIHNTGA